MRYGQIDLIHDLLRRGVTCKGALKGFVANKSAEKALLELIVANGADDVAGALDPGHVDGTCLDRTMFGPNYGSFERWEPEKIRQRHRALSLMLNRFPNFTKTPEAVEWLGEAARGNDQGLVEMLFSSGVALGSIDSRGYTALHQAVLGPKAWDSLDWLLQNCANLEQRVVARGWLEDRDVGSTPCKFLVTWRIFAADSGQ